MDWFWSSDKLTGNQTRFVIFGSDGAFWSSDKLTGNQTNHDAVMPTDLFWSSDKLTGNQTVYNRYSYAKGFGAVTN